MKSYGQDVGMRSYMDMKSHGQDIDMKSYRQD